MIREVVITRRAYHPSNFRGFDYNYTQLGLQGGSMYTQRSNLQSTLSLLFRELVNPYNTRKIKIV